MKKKEKFVIFSKVMYNTIKKLNSLKYITLFDLISEEETFNYYER